ncbi:hypothetical protein NUITMVR1_18120 [Raoultella ornithinolytica]|nr:hypothetical protein NUITMVR1_18120 [Raoultella ornithinolytica]CAE6333127.1 hypothetical protein AI2711V1_1782 [Raoultella ornithinolytica]CAH3441146.1 hypothetical protein AI2711V1_1782 [Raoultella ornithinolytica]
MVENDTSSVDYQLSTSTGPFGIPFYFIENAHIVAELYTQNGDEFNKTTLTIDVDYYLNGAGDKDGGQLTLLAAHSGATLLIYRDPDATQLTSYLATGKFPATSHERALDKLTMLIQKFGWWWDSLALKKPNIFANYYDAMNNRIRNLRDPALAQDAATKSYVDSSDSDLQQQITSNFNRSLRVPDSYISQLPTADERAWKGLGFDGAGQPKLQDPAGTGLWGYVPAIGSFEKGSLLTQRFEVLLWESTDEYWRWDGAMPKIVLPGSTPDTAGGRGKGKWIDVTDATLRANLGSGDGQKLIGEYSSVSELRAATLDYHGQKVKLRCWDMAQTTALFDVFYVYDATDTASTDDGYRTIVNAQGQRFKALLSDAIDLRIAGLRSYGDNLGTAFNRVLTAELARVFGSGSAMKMATIKLPALSSFDDPDISTYNAILNASIVMPSFLPVAVDGNYFCKFNPTNDVALKITNSLPGVTPSLIPWRDMKSVKMFTNTSGHFELIGPGSTASQAAGLQIGNASAGDSVLDLRGLSIDDIQIRAFRYGLDFIWNDTYILKFHNIELTGNYTNISSLIAGKVNSGENVRINESLIADSVSHQVNFNSPGIGLTFDGCSTDYAGGSVFYLDNGARGNTIDYNGGHIEGWGGMLALQVAQSVAWYGYPNSLTFNGTQIKAAGNSPGVWASRRKILHSGVVLDELGTKVMFRDSPIYWPAPASEPHVALTGYTDPTPQYMRVIYNCPNSPYPDCLGSYRQSTNKGLYRFGGTEGNSVKGLVDSLTGFTFSTNGNPTIVYGGVDSDGLQHIIINFDATTTWVEICNKGLYYALEREAEINTALSVMMENITEGDLKLNTRFLYYYGAAKTYDGYEDGKTKSLTSLLTATYNGLTTPLTTSMYVGEQTALSYIRQDSAHPTQAEYVQPAIVLRGAKGQARIKLPAIWPTKGRGSAFVFS